MNALPVSVRRASKFSDELMRSVEVLFRLNRVTLLAQVKVEASRALVDGPLYSQGTTVAMSNFSVSEY